jgi:hypothetical protein
MEGLREVRIVSIPAVIRTEHLLNASLERYRYTNLLRKFIFPVLAARAVKIIVFWDMTP